MPNLTSKDGTTIAEAYMIQGANMPAEAVANMRNAPFWPGVEAVAHTLIHDATTMSGTMAGMPHSSTRWAGVSMPALILNGGARPAWMSNAAQALAGLLPNARRQTLEGQTHDVAVDALVPALEQFFTAQGRGGQGA